MKSPYFQKAFCTASDFLGLSSGAGKVKLAGGSLSVHKVIYFMMSSTSRLDMQRKGEVWPGKYILTYTGKRVKHY